METNLNTLRDAIYEDAVAHGLWEDHDKWFGTLEQIEARSPSGDVDLAVDRRHDCALCVRDECDELTDAHGSIEEFSEELADVIIMSLSVAGKLGIDIDTAVRRKMEINKQRPWKHEGEKK